MILTISLNPAIDKTYIIPGFDPVGINRTTEVVAVAGGKANNVARVLRTLGSRVRATGFLAGEAGRWVDRELAAIGVESRFLEVEGQTRTCLALVDPSHGGVGEIREPGPVISAADQARFLGALPKLAAGCSLAVMSGSLPVGVPPAYVNSVVAVLKGLDIPVILDVSGNLLRAGLRAGPLLIKPNLDELSDLVGRPLSEAEVPEAVSDLARQWGMSVVASLGKAGVVAADRNGHLLRAVAPQVPAVNTVGAGDSLVAGLAVALSEGNDLAAAVRLGMACGTASVLTEGVAAVRFSDVQALLGRVEVRQ